MLVATLVVLAGTASLAGSRTLPASEVHAPDRFVVVFDDLPRDLDPGDRVLGGTVRATDEALSAAVVETVEPGVPSGPGAGESEILAVRPDPRRSYLPQTTRDPLAGELYGLDQIRARDAWNTTDGVPTVTICFLDTGVRHTHEDLRGDRWRGGIDLVNGDGDPSDDHGHGTHVTGTAVATLDNGRGIAGVAQVGFLAAKVLDASGRGHASDIALGVVWCEEHGADVINLSLGAPEGSPVLHAALRHAHREGVLLVASAGNRGPCRDCVSFPAARPEVIAVGCTNRTAAVCPDSSRGPQLELAAPGDAILSTLATNDTSYGSRSGTSSAVPHVSATAALTLSAAPALQVDELRSILQTTAQDTGSDGPDPASGHGIVDARAAVHRAR